MGLLTLLLLPFVFAQQTPLFSLGDGGDAYQLKWPIRKVAVIGAGPGGLIAYRELTHLNFTVHLIERDTVPGGNWHYSDEVPLYTPIPTVDVAPKPIWKTLKSNLPSIREFPWPKGTPWELPHQKIQRYVRAFASYHGINSNDDNPNVRYNTRVELAEEYYNDQGERDGWILTLKTVTKEGGVTKATWTKEHYDAVVVATGRYNSVNVPRIPGLETWAKAFPERLRIRGSIGLLMRSKGKVLIVGAVTSGGEISREINPLARLSINTVPHLNLNTFLRRLPANTTIVPEIRRFLPPNEGKGIEEGQVELVNGTILTGIDNIIFGTGYRYTFPFLPQYTNASLGTNGTLPRSRRQPIITDGTHLRSLYLDTFYIDDPSLAFVNMNTGVEIFSYSEYLSLAIGKVWSRTAFLPSTPRLWEWYDAVVEERQGYGKHFLFLTLEGNTAMVRFFVAWLNDAAVKYGGRQIEKIWYIARFGEADLSAPAVNSVEYRSLFWG
ncbi:hypothetical protein BDQ17DRAFT_1368117 [Cyathus striatus]|nr:hypothetical protein BDQ17DRAFT_1368117 [Cyathus striatus]